MKLNFITLKDIAKTLGVSISTVSRALKNHPDVKPETIQAVKELAEKLHYKPNVAALSLRKRQSKIIGLIIPEISYFFFPSVLKGIEEVARIKGYNVMILQSEESFRKEVDCTEILLSNSADGIIISVSKETMNYDHFNLARMSGVPVVFIDKVPSAYQSDKIVVDGEDGTFMAIEYLIKCGYSRIAIGLGNSNISITRDRLNGYIRAHRTYGLPIQNEYIINCNNEEEARELTLKLLELSIPPEAIFTISDQVVTGALTAIHKKIMKIPDQIAVISFSDEPFCSLFNPPLTSVTPKGYDMGKEAATLLIQRIEDSNMTNDFMEKKLKTELIIRGSTIVPHQ